MITVKLWKDINDFNPLESGKFDLDGTVKRIAEVKDIPVEEVEKMPISDILPEFLDCVRIVNEEVFKKVNLLPKNGNGDGQ